MAAVTTSPPISPPAIPPPAEKQPPSAALPVDSSARLRDAPISPVRVDFQEHAWSKPSNVNIEDAARHIPQIQLASMTLDSNPVDDAARSHLRTQEVHRSSRESDESNATSQAPASLQSSAPTTTSSVSATQENPNCAPLNHSSASSTTGDAIPPNQSVPLFQYHHQQETSSNPSASSTPDPVDNAAHIRRHLTPTMQAMRRTSMPRPQSSYSNYSDFGPRGLSPLPGSPHMRPPSGQARRSPDNRHSTYAELLNVPYPQQGPAPLTWDNSNLRGVVGNNASLLSAQKTLEMYRQNVKKTTDFSIQYSFAVFLISTAQEQGLDWTDPKKKPAAHRDLDSPVVEVSVASPIELVREAKQILQRLANGGYPFAQYYLADGYASGLFNKGKADYNSAFPLFVLAAKHGHAESAYRTALCYEFGWGCRKDPAKAVQFLRSAASKSHPGAMTRLGKACLSGDLGEKRYREGIKWMKLATEAADTQYNAAPYQLGCLYETGYGDDIFQDWKYTAELFTQAADLGHPEANYRMGDAYEHGLLDCPKDPALSVHFYTGAAERGHAAGMMGLCAWYMVGAIPILEKDEEEAYEWARRSADLGYVKAQYAVGYFLEMGIGCRRDILEANVWYVRAADAGDKRAKQRLSVIQAAIHGGTPMEVAPRNGGKKDDKDCVVM
ncbi:chitin synthase activator [Cordyceps javanica]|uniref:Chitin synthase activator n=1 Tax=Cordyceps javanica TaxID=43265 RepID=A0A545VYT7_9HYPO|nr:chitin synthase activator [Cordyceps javanica]TQW06892.1 chitin synthase activator [Cordyceps javanica]